ncbi:MAG: serpin family protein [Prosthecobacter sp.]|uniref:serpin family protein n=1 Tax=Prosthecobacter sp. TaxID=1965333 RepID=UPI0038FF27ED
MKTLIAALSLVAVSECLAVSPETAAMAVNQLGLDLHRQMPKRGNLCLSPYSIQSALAMTYLGASGVTQEEMMRVLHFPADKEKLGKSFAALNQSLNKAQQTSARYDAPAKALQLHVANRLFGQLGYEFRKPFLSGVQDHFSAPLRPMNFRKDPGNARAEINGWVAEQTRDRIRDLIPRAGVTNATRLVLVNALYFKAAWSAEFALEATHPKPFYINGGNEVVNVPTMNNYKYMSYHRGRGFQAVTLPYIGDELHFLLIVPDSLNGFASVEQTLTPKILLACANARERPVILHLPKFKITPPTVPLGKVLQTMGLTTAFDKPRGSADFDAMAPKKPGDYLCISEVFHKTFLELDEKGTEAAAATAVAEDTGGGGGYQEPEKPIEIKADRPFIFAIQHAASGACLFLGRVNDPR